MNDNSTVMNKDIGHIKQWILTHLHQECNIDAPPLELPLMEQLDSFQVVGFLVACDDKFQTLKLTSTDSFNGLTIDEVASFIASKINQ